MSHFSVLVALQPGEAANPNSMEELFAPYDEGLAVEPYPVEDDWIGKYLLEKEPGLDITDAEAFSAALAKHELDDEKYTIEDGTIYRMSTYNPDSKWDYWRVGGRWAGNLVLKPGAEGVMQPLSWEWDNEANIDFSGRADVARKGDVDFDRVRQEAVDAANAEWDAYEAAVAEYGPLPDMEWVKLFETDREAAEAARTAYWNHPGVAALKGDAFFAEPPTEKFQPDRETYVERARLNAVTCYAYLDSENGWLEPGRMGWFGMSNDTADSREDYAREVNRILDELPDDAVLAVVDCHI